jgi:nitric oxide synthase oxygenase domain/subunit
LGERGAKLDEKAQQIDRIIVKNWDDLIGPLSDADKKAFRRQYPDEAEEYDKITTHYGWPKKF